MNRFTGPVVVLALSISAAWAQAPAPQNSAPAAPNSAPAAQSANAAPAQQSTVSGCMIESFGRFTVADPATSRNWEVKGINLWNYQNHMVKVQGLVDPKSATPLLYAQTVQDAGGTCGNGQAAGGAPNIAANGTAAGATAGTPGQTPNATQTQGTAAQSGMSNGSANGTSAQPGSEAQPGATSTQPSTTQGSSTPGQSASPQASSGSTNQNSSAQTSAQASQTGTTGVTQSSSAPQTSENKGVPTAGTPQGAIGSNSQGQSATSNDDNSVFNGCLVGSVNNYQFKANGKNYRLQGNTLHLNTMVNHQVEITGQDFNGKAIQVNGARDLGNNCK